MQINEPKIQNLEILRKEMGGKVDDLLGKVLFSEDQLFGLYPETHMVDGEK